VTKLLRVVRRLIWTGVKLALVALVFFIAWVWFANGYAEVPAAHCAARPVMGLAAIEAKTPGYRRPEAATYLAFPEQHLAQNAHEYAQAIAAGSPSRYPYFKAIVQYWRAYYRVFKITQAKYGFKMGEHRLPIMIGLGFTIENTTKGIYENTIGRLTEQLSEGGKSDEDRQAARAAAEYATFIRTAPSYKFQYGRPLSELWKTPFRGAHQVRKIERRMALTIEYGLNAFYDMLLGIAAPAGNQPEQIHALALVTRSPEVIPLPRNELFTAAVSVLAGKGVTIYEIAGNDEIFVTALGPASTLNGGTDSPLKPANTWRVEFVEPLLTEPSTVRIGLTVPPSCLGRLLADLQSTNGILERIYPY
jgi:hypothetical protein